MFAGDNAKYWIGSANLVDTVTEDYSAAYAAVFFAPGAALANLDYAATNIGALYATAAGTGGVVPGAFDPDKINGPVQWAEDLGMNALDIPSPVYNVLNYFGAGWTAKQGFIDAAAASGQDFFLSSPAYEAAPEH